MIKYLDFNSKCAMATYVLKVILRGAETKSFENHNIQFLPILMHLSLNQAEEV